MPPVCQEVYQELEIQEWALPLWSSQSSAKELIKKIQRSLRYLSCDRSPWWAWPALCGWKRCPAKVMLELRLKDESVVASWVCGEKAKRTFHWARNILWRRKWQTTQIFLPGKSHGQGSLVGYSPWGHKRVRRDSVTKQQQQLKFHKFLC